MRELTIEEYNKEMDKIIAMRLSVNDTLTTMLEFASGVKIVSPIIKEKEK